MCIINRNERVLSCFRWKLIDVIANLKSIANAGFTCILISPMQPTKNPSSDVKDWWLLYQPLSFTIGNKQIGTKEDLKRLCKEAKKYDIKIIADLVINHTASMDDCCTEPNEKVDPYLIKRADFWKEKRLITNWDDRYQVIHYSTGLPCLDLSNHDLQKIIIQFIREYIECGIGGFRFDSAKSIALPSEGSDFWSNITAELNKYPELFNFAEVIFTNDSKIMDEYTSMINVVTNSHVNDNSKKIAYAESHDTFLDEKIGETRNIKSEDIINRYVYDIVPYNKNSLLYCRPEESLWALEKIKASHKKYA